MTDWYRSLDMMPACEDTLRRWRRAENPDELCLLDINKAYMQVRVAYELLRFQTVLWQGCVYVMTRMGFGLNLAPR